MAQSHFLSSETETKEANATRAVLQKTKLPSKQKLIFFHFERTSVKLSPFKNFDLKAKPRPRVQSKWQNHEVPELN